MSRTNFNINPFKGLAPYLSDEEDAYFFCGRNNERDIVIANLASSRLTLLYGPTGVGKSSLLQAGVKYYLENLLTNNIKNNKHSNFVIVTFNNWHNNPIEGLIIAIKQAIINSDSSLKLADISNNDFIIALHQWVNTVNKDLYIILDQFEEYLLYFTKEFGEQTFFNVFPNIVNSFDLRINFLISIREDFISKLDCFKDSIPNLFDNMLRIDPLTFETGYIAIQDPIKRYNEKFKTQYSIEKNLIEEILRQVRTKSYKHQQHVSIKPFNEENEVQIDATCLQIVMKKLWESALNVKSTSLELSLLHEMHGVNNIIDSHVNDILDRLTDQEKYIASRLFFHLVTPSGTKIAHSIHDLIKYVGSPLPDKSIVPDELIQSDFSPATITNLLKKFCESDYRLLRSFNMHSLTNLCFELFHDKLAESILQWCSKYSELAYANYSVQPIKHKQTVINYEGWGIAEFIKPEGTAEGFVKISFDETGVSSIEMDVEVIKTDYSMELGFIQFITAQMPWYGNNRVGISLGFSSKNPCSKLKVTTEKGVFLAIKDTNHSEGLIYGYSYGSRNQLKFQISASQFDSTNVGNANYWKLPLSNFFADFVQNTDLIKGHPLLSDSTRYAILFKFQKNIGFIEPVYNYYELKDSITTRKEQSKITAYMVADISLNSIELNEVLKWMPVEVIGLLGLATGSQPAIPWLEFYDNKNNLVRRIHQSFGEFQYIRGHAAINEACNIGIGYLITKCTEFLSNSANESFPLLTVLRNIVRAGRFEQQTLEGKFTALIHAFSALTSYYNVNKQDLLNNIEQSHRNYVNSTINIAIGQIKQLIDNEFTNNRQPSDQLFKIFSMLETMFNHARDFGLGIHNLIIKFGLNDSSVMANYYNQLAEFEKLSWVGLLNKYYETIIEYGYFDFIYDKGKNNALEIWGISLHLHDILVRIIFKIIGYDGTYQPTVSKYANVVDINVDWVKPDTSFTKLGYSSNKRFDSEEGLGDEEVYEEDDNEEFN